MNKLKLLVTIFILGVTIHACAGAEPSATATPAAMAESSTNNPLPVPTGTAAALPISPPVLGPTPVQTLAGCTAPSAGKSVVPAEDHATGPPPETYALRVRVESTSLWASVEVTGVNSMTSKYALIQGDGRINVQIKGLDVYELSVPEGGPYENQNVILEIDAIVQKQDDTAVFRMTKERSGTVVYKLFSGSGDSATEIARFTNDAADDGDNLKTFVFDLDTLPPPISFAAADERYQGPLFDAHAHLVGSSDREHTAARDDRLHINSETADRFFAILDRENIIGLIGFLPVIHEFFDGDDSFNRSYQEQILSVVNRCDNKLIPFLFPYSHIGVPPNEHGPNLPKLIDQAYRGNPIPFRGIGEIHSGGILADSYTGMRLVDPAMLELYDFAAANGLIVMIHPELVDFEDLQRALMHNPETVFLLHGLVSTSEAITEEIDTLFREHSNVYYSIDASLIPEYGLQNAQVENKEQFMANLHSESMYYRLLASALVYFKPIIDAHPTRLMWGTDLIYSWNYESDTMHELARFARDFIAGLDPEAQEGFAYKNAVQMLGLPLNEGD